MLSASPKHLKGDIYGGLTAAVVALPLALAFGEASGAGPIAGLYGAIFVGFFAALLGGTPSQVSGPTGPMIVVFAGIYSALNGEPGLVFATVILAGILQIAFGVLKLGQYIRLVPYPVVSGFMTGIGCIIIALQASRLFGHEPIGTGTIPAISAIPSAIADPNGVALGLSVLTLIIVFKWPRNLGKFVPPPLAALIIGTVLSELIVGAPILGDIPTGLPSFVMPTMEQETAMIVFEAALVLALLGSLDSLLTSLVADNMTRTKHNSNQELIGQGAGNIFAGFFGGIPGAGATMRTVVNIRTGGRTKLSGMLHSLFLLSIVILLAPLASKIPHAVLAGILVKTGYDIIDFTYLRRAHRGPRWDLALMLVVLILTIFVDLITAVIVGVVLASLAFVKQMSDLQLAELDGSVENISGDLSEEEESLLKAIKNQLMFFEFSGPLSFGAASDLVHQMRQFSKDRSALILDFSRVPFIDASAARAMETISCDAQTMKKPLYIFGMNAEVRQVLRDLEADCCLEDKMFFQERSTAISVAHDYIVESERHGG
ncbi:MAG: sodium-independent anion transporter [Gammaproteobacteria bacterium]|nr:sodium-independent anion transporter [Gammaproteobacteria bacterium]